MKKLILVATLLLVCTSLVLSQTLPQMANTKHDFRASSTGDIFAAPSEKLCSYCHTPHVPAGGIKTPLWAKTAPSGTFDPYTNIDGQLVGDRPLGSSPSALCMSCHDGSTFLAAATFLKRPYAGTAYVSPTAWDNYTGTGTVRVGDMTVGTAANLHGGRYGTGLSHTHPVNFSYAGYTTGYNNPPATVTDGTISRSAKLYNNTVQCGSCHDPHLSGKMVRITTDHGVLCISCHAK